MVFVGWIIAPPSSPIALCDLFRRLDRRRPNRWLHAGKSAPPRCKPAGSVDAESRRAPALRRLAAKASSPCRPTILHKEVAVSRGDRRASPAQHVEAESTAFSVALPLRTLEG